MREKFGFGSETTSSSRIECNFKHIKNRIFKNENLPLRIDTFLEKLISYYRGDHLLVQAKYIERQKRPLSEYIPLDKTNVCKTFIDELEETNARLILEDKNYEKDIHSDEDKSSEEVDTREKNTQSAEDKQNGTYILRKVND
jgi:antitoxin component YwqK of YwqJK toxin-antitoxin module